MQFCNGQFFSKFWNHVVGNWEISKSLNMWSLKVHKVQSPQSAMYFDDQTKHMYQYPGFGKEIIKTFFPGSSAWRGHVPVQGLQRTGHELLIGTIARVVLCPHLRQVSDGGKDVRRRGRKCHSGMQSRSSSGAAVYVEVSFGYSTVIVTPILSRNTCKHFTH